MTATTLAPTRDDIRRTLAGHGRWTHEYPGFYALRVAPTLVAGMGDPALYAGTPDGIQVWIETTAPDGAGTGEQVFAPAPARTLAEALAQADALIAGALAERIADGFIKVLQDWLTAGELAEIDRRNAAEPDQGVCHSHDFCDANMAMLEPFEAATGTSPVEDTTLDWPVRLWGAAWSIALAKGFALKG